jgi:hypothetical protein
MHVDVTDFGQAAYDREYAACGARKHADRHAMAEHARKLEVDYRAGLHRNNATVAASTDPTTGAKPRKQGRKPFTKVPSNAVALREAADAAAASRTFVNPVYRGWFVHTVLSHVDPGSAPGFVRGKLGSTTAALIVPVLDRFNVQKKIRKADPVAHAEAVRVGSMLIAEWQEIVPTQPETV